MRRVSISPKPLRRVSAEEDAGNTQVCSLFQHNLRIPSPTHESHALHDHTLYRYPPRFHTHHRSTPAMILRDCTWKYQTSCVLPQTALICIQLYNRQPPLPLDYIYQDTAFQTRPPLLHLVESYSRDALQLNDSPQTQRVSPVHGPVSASPLGHLETMH